MRPLQPCFFRRGASIYVKISKTMIFCPTRSKTTDLQIHPSIDPFLESCDLSLEELCWQAKGHRPLEGTSTLCFFRRRGASIWVVKSKNPELFLLIDLRGACGAEHLFLISLRYWKITVAASRAFRVHHASVVHATSIRLRRVCPHMTSVRMY